MIRSLLIVPLAILPIVSFASDLEQIEKFGYKHVSLDLGAGTTNEEWLDSSNSTSLGLGGHYLLSDNWLLNADYSVQFIHPKKSTLRLDRLMLGAGYRYAINHKLDVFALYGLGILKERVTSDEKNKTLSSERDFLHGVTLGMNYLLIGSLVAIAEVHVNRSDIVHENNYKVGFNYQWHDVVGTGLYYQYRDTDYQYTPSEHINEVGLYLKFVY
ncbi:outer membrane beta-barrel protein [Vibrio sagamiensis]|uniref:Membrane protein n=1 Tax=Vibrio sagamiensis NBRC 104589 TaxID=1219064 RepID=A0A511QB73_9VIBR|nr:outer membrane beta-barrel protein [Vibrio sagamiensis]PNQ56240.1 hypothetical protein C1141_13860 [Vibrio agarivorans]GEM74477.1 membrane protein [Vibrio sagamiensis NBRC 104589]